MVFLIQAFYGQGINFEIFVKVIKVSKNEKLSFCSENTFLWTHWIKLQRFCIRKIKLLKQPYMISLLHHFRIMMSIRISFWLHDLTTLCSDFDLWSIEKSQKYYIFSRKSCIAPNYFKLNFLRRNCNCVILTKVWFKERRAGYKFDQPNNKVNF